MEKLYMLINTIKEIISNYRNSISLEQLEEELITRNQSISIKDLVSQSQYFHLSNGVVFLKSTLLENKKNFLLEFDDYIKSKALSKTLKNNLTTLLNIYIPEILYAEWIGLNLESKLLVFELLFCFFIKPKRTKDRVKIFFNRLLEFNSLLAIVSLIILNDYDSDLEKITIFIKKIEPHEEALKNQLYNILCSPETFSKRLDIWKKELYSIEENINEIIQTTFAPSLNYSPQLFKRVIEKKLRHFELLGLLSRFENNSLYEWLLTQSEKESGPPPTNLIDD